MGNLPYWRGRVNLFMGDERFPRMNPWAFGG